MIEGSKIYENIQRLSYKQDRTVNSVCKDAGVSPGIISDLKNGRRKQIGIVTLKKLATALDCSIEDITEEAVSGVPVGKFPKANRIEPFIERAIESMRERPEIRRLLKAAMNANRQQVLSTAILLESIVDVQSNTTERVSDE
jgi:DNA-binding Xre family transcriptional regulator